MTILTVGIDLAKNVFAVHGVNEAGKAELVRPAVPRDKLHELIASLPPCVIGMEACSGALHWAQLFQAAGHTVRLIAPKFATPYRMTGKRGKNDAADAAAICEAIQRSHMPALADATATGLEGTADEEMARKAGHQGFVWLDGRGSPCSVLGRQSLLHKTRAPIASV